MNTNLDKQIENCSLGELIDHLNKIKEKIGADARVVVNHIDTKKSVNNVEILASKNNIVIFGF